MPTVAQIDGVTTSCDAAPCKKNMGHAASLGMHACTHRMTVLSPVRSALIFGNNHNNSLDRKARVSARVEWLGHEHTMSLPQRHKGTMMPDLARVASRALTNKSVHIAFSSDSPHLGRRNRKWDNFCRRLIKLPEDIKSIF